MKFFIPNAESSEQEEVIYESLKKCIKRDNDVTLSGRKIYSIWFRHDGRDCLAVVGEIDPIQSELILAIFFEPSRDVYHVCTASRGLLAGSTILVGGDEVYKFVDFNFEYPVVPPLGPKPFTE